MIHFDARLAVPALYFLACVGNLVLAIVVVSRGRGRRGALPLALLCLSLFLWNAGEAAHNLPGVRIGGIVRLVGSCMAPAFLFHFVLCFLRREREYRRAVGLAYGLPAVMAILTAGALVVDVAAAFVIHWAWNVLYFLAVFPFPLGSLYLIVREIPRVENRVERNALQCIALGIVIGVVTGATELTVALGSPIPPLGHLGGLASMLLLAAAVLRHRALDRDFSGRAIGLILLATAAAVAGSVLLSLKFAGGRGGLAVLSLAVLIFTLLATYRFVVVRWLERQDRLRRLEMLGTMAAGVAHEIRNPLASIKGAAQLVQRELESRPVGGAADEYLKLVVAETERLNQVVEKFLDLARPLAPKPQSIGLAKLLEGIPGVEVDGEGTLSADPDLLRVALENLIRNAREAEATRVVVRIRPSKDRVAVEVQDDGTGIPPEHVPKLFQPFATTKARGTGLGLAIVRRIVESHGGEIGVTNVEPHGARFTMILPTPGDRG